MNPPDFIVVTSPGHLVDEIGKDALAMVKMRRAVSGWTFPHDSFWILPILFSSLPSKVGSFSFPDAVLLLPFTF
jgi:hypothetical protein